MAARSGDAPDISAAAYESTNQTSGEEQEASKAPVHDASSAGPRTTMTARQVETKAELGKAAQELREDAADGKYCLLYRHISL